MSVVEPLHGFKGYVDNLSDKCMSGRLRFQVNYNGTSAVCFKQFFEGSLSQSNFLKDICDSVIQEVLKIPFDCLYYTINSKHPSVYVNCIFTFNDLTRFLGHTITISIYDKLLGGKGGFGALLRRQKKGNKRIKNYDACRDLSGRRIRHAKTLERLTTWAEKKKADDELVAALTAAMNEKPKISEEEIKMNRELKRVGESYSAGIESTQKQTVDAIEEAFSKELTFFPKTLPKKQSDFLTAQYLNDIYDDYSCDENDDEEQQEFTSISCELQNQHITDKIPSVSCN